MILITGGCGYIGSHFAVKLLENDKPIILLDNLSNSSQEVINAIEKISNSSIRWIKGDIKDKCILQKIFRDNTIESVIHFAGFKSLPKSFEYPIDYYLNNVNGTINLINEMNRANIKKIIFSSSATVYGDSHILPWNENLDLKIPKSPYAQSKFIIENFLRNIFINDHEWSVGILRYFNPIGAHSSGLLGEEISNDNTNLFPAILNVYLKNKTHLDVYGNDFNTCDGTGIRDYIHIDDLVDGHLKAMEFIDIHNGYNIWNLGSGKGYSVFQVLKEFEKASETKIPYKIRNRRKGDIGEYWADIKKSKIELNWHARKGLREMIFDIINYANKI